MDDLRHCYEKLRDIIGSSIEPFSVVQEVDRYRTYWKPETVKTILLAESHVHTTGNDHEVRLNNTMPNLPSYPDRFTRFVYCLGYGENGLLEKKIEKNSGTPDFWKILYSCCHPVQSQEDFRPLLKGSTSNDERISNKVETLFTLQERGIWLVDASIIGINGKYYPGYAIYEKVLATCWEYYIGKVITATSPENIICIGKRVGKVLEDRIVALTGRKPIIFPLPSDHLASQEKVDLFRNIGNAVNGESPTTLNDIPAEPAYERIIPKPLKGTKTATIRRKALMWLKGKYDITNQPVYTSKFYTPDISYTGASAWWIQIPGKHYRPESAQYVHVICQEVHGSDDFYYLCVPCDYLKQYEKELGFIGDAINLYLSAEANNRFQDERGKGKIRFAQFLVSASKGTKQGNDG